MLTEAIIQTSTPTSLKIDDADPDEILILESISGLSDVKVNLFMGEFAREGGYYQGRRAEKRNYVFNFKIQPNHQLNIMANNVRELIYRMFMEPQRNTDSVQVVVKDDELPDRYFIAYTETITAPIFEKDMKAQCSLMSTDAYLRSVNLSAGSNSLGWYAIPMGYEGSADTGLSFTVKVLNDASAVRVINGEDFMELTGPFLAGDILHISTTQGNREILLNGADKMSAMTAPSQWLQLRERDNTLKVSGPTLGDGQAVITDYEYRAAWWGV